VVPLSFRRTDAGRAGGTTRCYLAARITEDPSVTVLLLERGSVHDAWFSRIPLMSSDVTSKTTPIVRSLSAPIEAAEGQVVNVVHAQTLGGGSAVNAMLVNFDHWAELEHLGITLRSSLISSSPKRVSATLRGIVASRVGFFAPSPRFCFLKYCSGPLVNQSFPDLPYKVQRK
jgi:hypothetical protein